MTIYRFLADGSEVLAILVTIFGLIRFKRLSLEIRYIFYFVALGALTEVVTDLYKNYIDKVTLPIGHFYLPLSFLILLLFFNKVLDGYISKKIIWFLGISYLIFALLNPVFIQSLTVFPNLTGAIGSIILVIFAVLLFYRITYEATILKLYKEPLVWINTMVLIYYSGNFFFYILFNYSVGYSLEFARLTVLFNAMLNFFIYIIFGFVFLMIPEKLGGQKVFENNLN